MHLARQNAAILIALILAARVIAKQAPTVHQNGANARTVPMLYVDGRPVISVTINGRGPYRMVLDTGAKDTVVSPGWVGGRTEQTDIDLRVGDQAYTHFPAWSFPLPRGFPKGVLSAEAFPGELVTLDFPKRTVTFQRGSLPPADGRRIFQYEAGDLLPTVPIRVGGHEMRVCVDSGNPRGLDLPLRLSAEIPLAGRLVAAGKGGIITNEGDPAKVAMFSAHVMGAVELGEYTLDTPTIRFRDQPAPWPGDFGNEILRTFRVTIDASNRRLLFER